MTIAEHTRAVLMKDLPAQGLRAGDYGVVVHVGHDPKDASLVLGYMLEIFAADGSTLGVVDVPADAVRPGRPDDIPCVRPVAAE